MVTLNMNELKLQGTIINFDSTTLGTVQVRIYKKIDRIKRALKSLGIFWAFAIFSILVPILHFILVPTFFCIGLYLVFRSSQLQLEILNGCILCPNCKKQIQIKPIPIIKWPHPEICQSCAATVKLVPL
jgi:hypothetical protein